MIKSQPDVLAKTTTWSPPVIPCLLVTVPSMQSLRYARIVLRQRKFAPNINSQRRAYAEAVADKVSSQALDLNNLC